MNQQPPGGFGGGSGYPQPGPMVPPQPPKSGMGTGAIIAIVVGVVALALVAIVGIFAVLGVYGTRKYIANAKTAESRNALGQIAKDAVAAYEREDFSGTVPAGGSVVADRHLCPSAERPVPASVASISGKKYQSAASEWSGDRGWSCLKFEMMAPQYYQYNYASTPSAFTATAKGDLNGDMVLSTFEIEGQVQNGAVRVSPSIKETNPEE